MPVISMMVEGDQRVVGQTAASTPRSRYQNLSDPDSLREFARNLREGIYITTRDGRILDANPAFLQLFGVSSVDDLRSFTAADLVVDTSRRKDQMALVD